MQTPARIPTLGPGAHLQLRDAVWRVTRVDTTSSGYPAWSCVGVSEIVRDQAALFLAELELAPGVDSDFRVLAPEDTLLVRDTSPEHRDARLFLETLLRDVPPTDGRLYLGQHAPMDTLPYQLVPAAQALAQPRQRILIADAVGLGKTLEAGILLAELIRRGRGRRILVATVKSMMTQFQKEMWCRFGLPLVRLDSTGLQRIRAHLPTHHNPFHHYDRVIISIDTLKQDNGFQRHLAAARWDVVVIDEAHNVAARGGGRSQRARVADLLSRTCEHLLLLSATPHDGRPESFASLMRMLDETAIADPSKYTRADIDGLFVRRFKKDVAADLGQKIPERRTHCLKTQASPAEEALFDALASLSLVHSEGRAGAQVGGSAGTGGTMLFKQALTKAIFSSPMAGLQTLRERIRTLQKLAAKGAATTATHDIDALGALEPLLEALVTDRDAFSKYTLLLDTLRRKLGFTGKKPDDRVVIFSERLETLKFLETNLPADLGLKAEQMLVMHGGAGLSDRDLMEAVETFGKSNTKVRVLLASDMASEGLNLHWMCARLVHFDVPWSLMVFQQRNGRIDRYGQKREPHIAYLLTHSANPKVLGDARILEVLVEKDKQAQINLGDPAAVMGMYDIAEEEALTAAAMNDAVTAEAFAATLSTDAGDDLLGRLLAAADTTDEAAFAAEWAAVQADAAVAALAPVGSGPASMAHLAGPPPPPPPSPGRAGPGPTEAVPVRQGSMPSLFASDFDYFATGLQHLQASSEHLLADVRPTELTIELSPPPDLERRMRRWPIEVQRPGERVLCTADPQKMQRLMDDARREELAWPRHHWLWATSPLMEWLGDRLRGQFGRHAAPVLYAPGSAPAGGEVYLLSAQCPGRRGAPLVHVWYAVTRDQSGGLTLGHFEEFLASAGLRAALPNPAHRTFDTGDLRPAVVAAVSLVRDAILAERTAWLTREQPHTDHALARLERRRERQLCLALPGTRPGALSETQPSQPLPGIVQRRRDAERARIEARYRDLEAWTRDARTPVETPFIQVVGVILGARP